MRKALMNIIYTRQLAYFNLSWNAHNLSWRLQRGRQDLFHEPLEAAFAASRVRNTIGRVT